MPPKRASSSGLRCWRRRRGSHRRRSRDPHQILRSRAYRALAQDDSAARLREEEREERWFLSSPSRSDGACHPERRRREGSAWTPDASAVSVSSDGNAMTRSLERTLGPRDLILIVIGTVIGSGIFIVPASVLRDSGGGAPGAFSLLSGVGAAMIA